MTNINRSIGQEVRHERARRNAKTLETLHEQLESPVAPVEEASVLDESPNRDGYIQGWITHEDKVRASRGHELLTDDEKELLIEACKDVWEWAYDDAAQYFRIEWQRHLQTVLGLGDLLPEQVAS